MYTSSELYAAGIMQGVQYSDSLTKEEKESIAMIAEIAWGLPSESCKDICDSLMLEVTI